MTRGERGQARIPELLAPAGTKEAFHAALEAGADAIYLSPQILNARAYGKNFTINQIAELKHLAGDRGVKTFVALNSVMKEEEIGDCVKLLAQLDEIGIDALIIQDLGIARIARRFFPDLRLHASTLMTIHNPMGVKTCQRLGFSRVVLARELTLKEIEQIIRKSNLEIEIFVHGAMCFSISGLCRFSSFYGGKSSTRGRCVQPCRRQYRWNRVAGTFFSMDDLCGIELLPDIARIGVSSLKIEGRLKPASYIYHVVQAYRQALDHIKDGASSPPASAIDHLKKAMGRPVTKGFFLGANQKGLVSPTRTANTGLFISKIKSYQKGSLTLLSDCDLSPGDRVRLVIKGLDKQIALRVKSVDSKRQVTIPAHAIPRELEGRLSGALLFKTDSKSDYRVDFSKKKTSARKPSYKTSMKNALSRAQRVLEELRSTKASHSERSTEPELAVFVEEPSALKDLARTNASKFILPLTKRNLKAVSSHKNKLINKGKIIWHLPAVAFGREEENIFQLFNKAKSLGFREFQASNLWHLSIPFGRVRVSSSYEFNILNSQALFAMKDLGVILPQFSIESDLANLEAALSRVPFKVSITAYGFIPLFTTRVKHSMYNPKKVVESLKGEKFHWRSDGQVGYLYPNAPFSFMDTAHALCRLGIARLILDLRFSPGKKKRQIRLPKSWKALTGKLRGRSFNLKGKLQ